MKIILELFGILISLIGFSLLIVQEKHIVASLLLLVFIVLSIHMARRAGSKPYKVKQIIYEYTMQDEKAECVQVKKITVLIPLEKNVTKLDDLGIGATGMVSDITTKNGALSKRDEGGSVSVTTTFDTALVIGREYSHEINYLGQNCFPERKEDVVHSTIHKIDEAIVKINFQEERKPTKFSATLRLGSKNTDVTINTVTQDNSSYTFRKKNPRRGSVFTIAWEW